MKKASIILLVTIIFVLMACNNSKTKEMKATCISSARIFPKGDVINNDNFNGTARLQWLVTDKDNFDVTVGNVIFEPSARNNWHSHPGGQILLCIKGKGYCQEKGKPIQLLNVGNVVEILPDVVHWHGATPDNEFEHIAIGTQASKGAAVWLHPVTDEEYNCFGK